MLYIYYFILFYHTQLLLKNKISFWLLRFDNMYCHPNKHALHHLMHPIESVNKNVILKSTNKLHTNIFYFIYIGYWSC